MLNNPIGTLCLALAVLIGSAGVSWSERLRLICTSTEEKMWILIRNDVPLIASDSVFATMLTFSKSKRVYNGWKKIIHLESMFYGKNEHSTIRISRYMGTAVVHSDWALTRSIMPLEYECVKARKKF